MLQCSFSCFGRRWTVHYRMLCPSIRLRCAVRHLWLSDGLRCGGSRQAREFKAFAQKRAVNYINENDPCPRAWGAINLCQLVEVAAKRLVDDLGSIKGFVASQAVAAAAQQVLDRPDFHLLEDLSRRYQHFAALKVLSSKRRRPLDANRLFDAVDDSRPECYIHSQVRQSQAKPNNQDFDDFANSRQPTARPPELSSLGTCRSVGLEPSPAAAIPSFSLDWIGRH